jgi:YXWGXW repeat-containing protein
LIQVNGSRCHFAQTPWPGIVLPALSEETAVMRLYRALLPALLMLALLVPVSPSPSQAAVSVGISVGFAPPALPVYDQPPIPGPGYVWMPGYWAWGPNGYYWVPGTWVLPPGIGLYWTPPWWGWNGAVYVFHPGYWGPSVGYYGGINYGFGYFGTGYVGGYWRSGRFYYNRELNNFGRRQIPWTYSRPFARPEHNGIGWNGGVGGMPGRPSARDEAAARERHWQPTGPQVQHFDTARRLPSLRSTTNNGQPPIVTTNRAGRFNNSGVVTRGGRLQGSPSEPHRN